MKLIKDVSHISGVIIEFKFHNLSVHFLVLNNSKWVATGGQESTRTV